MQNNNMWGEPEAIRLFWMVQRAVTQILSNMQPADTDEVTATIIWLAWENQNKCVISQKAVWQYLVEAYDVLFLPGCPLEGLERIDVLANVAVAPLEISDVKDNLVLLSNWRKEKHLSM
mgnify:CR=1 FL=1